MAFQLWEWSGNSLHDATKTIYELRQSDGDSIDRFLDRDEEVFKITEAAAGINCLILLVQRTSEKYKNLSDADWVEAVKAVTFFVKANKKLFGPKIREISEAVVLISFLQKENK